MSENVELSSLDLRYEGYRLRDDAREARLMASIATRGIEEPLEGVDAPERRFLLNGFKRYRCAKKLSLGCVPYVSLAAEEATGILNLMRVSTDKALGILDQARFIVDLLTLQEENWGQVLTLNLSSGWLAGERKRVRTIFLQSWQECFFSRRPRHRLSSGAPYRHWFTITSWSRRCRETHDSRKGVRPIFL